jgi:hypothetical protein
MMSLIQKLFGPADPWAGVHPDFTACLRKTLSTAEFDELTALLKRWKLLDRTHFGRESALLFSLWVSTTQALGHLFTANASNVIDHDVDAIRLCEFAEKLNPECPYTGAVMALLKLRTGQTEEALGLANQVHSAFSAAKDKIVNRFQDLDSQSRSTLKNNMDQIDRQLAILRSGRTTLGSYRSLLDEEDFNLLARAVRKSIDGSASALGAERRTDGIPDDQIPFHPSQALQLAQQLRDLRVNHLQQQKPTGPGDLQLDVLASVLDPQNLSLKANAALSLDLLSQKSVDPQDKRHYSSRAAHFAQEALELMETGETLISASLDKDGNLVKHSDDVRSHLRILVQRGDLDS